MLIGAPGVAGADLHLRGPRQPRSRRPAGAVCLNEAAPPDCVSWGAFSGGSMLPFPGAGAPAPAIGEGLSLTRTIARGCALGLDPEDDSDSSAADLTLGAPTPQPERRHAHRARLRPLRRHGRDDHRHRRQGDDPRHARAPT